jgi:hypothetical protein
MALRLLTELERTSNFKEVGPLAASQKASKKREAYSG